MSPLKYFTGCMIAASLLFSCVKKEPYDIKGDPAVKFYTNIESSGNAPQNSFSYSVINHPDPGGSGLLNLSSNIPATIKFPVLATKPVSQNVVIGAELDNSLVAKYNAEHQTSYAVFPAGVITASSLNAQILSGTTRSADSITLTTDPATFNSLTEPAYMAPVKLTTVSNAAGEITGNASSQVVYIVVNVELRQIRYNATAAMAIGSLISPRTSWTAEFNPAIATVGGNGSIFDGSTATWSRWANGTLQASVDVNMQGSQNVTGIRLYTSNASATTPTQIVVYLSSDGVNWNHIGSPLRANLTYASAYNYILFYKAIPAQFIRLGFTYSTSTNTQNFRVTEFDVYAN